MVKLFLYHIDITVEALVQLDDLVPPEDRTDIFDVIGPTTREGFSPDGALLAYPFGRMDGVYMLYNKKLIAAAGLDFEKNPPTTVAEFDTYDFVDEE